jgi:hypothetical protein
MARRDLLNDDERRILFGVPQDHDSLVKLYTLSPADGEVRACEARSGQPAWVCGADGVCFSILACRSRHYGDAPPQLVAFMARANRCPAGKVWSTMPSACRSCPNMPAS